MSYVMLRDLPVDHKLRNVPLIEIEAEYLPSGSKVWAKVMPAFNIAKRTYNELAECWTDNDLWRANDNG